MKDRLLLFLNKEGLSATVFADEIGVQRSSISHIISGRNNPSYDFIIKILEKYSYLNAEWLLTGKGDMYKEELTVNNPSYKDEGTLFKGPPLSNSVTKKSNQLTDKEFTNVNNVEKIVYFFKNGTFKEYNPLD